MQNAAAAGEAFGAGGFAVEAEDQGVEDVADDGGVLAITVTQSRLRNLTGVALRMPLEVRTRTLRGPSPGSQPCEETLKVQDST